MLAFNPASSIEVGSARCPLSYTVDDAGIISGGLLIHPKHYSMGQAELLAALLDETRFTRSVELCENFGGTLSPCQQLDVLRFGVLSCFIKLLPLR